MAVTNRSGISIGVDLQGTVIGEGIFTADTTASAQSLLGGSAVGRQIFEAPTTAAVVNIIGAGFVTGSAANIDFTPGSLIHVSGVNVQTAINQLDAAVDRVSAASIGGTAIGKAIFTATTTAAVHDLLESGTAGLRVFKAATTAAAVDLLGAGAVGKVVFAAATTAAALDSVGAGTVGKLLLATATTAAALDSLGGGAVGKQIFATATTAAAQTALELTFTNASIITGAGAGNKLIETGVKVSAQTISQYQGLIQNKTDSYALVSSDTGTVIVFSVTSAAVLTCPKTMPVGYVVEVIQSNTAAVTFTAATSAAVLNRSTHTKTAGQYAAVQLMVITNSDGSNAQYILAGDTGA